MVKRGRNYTYMEINSLIKSNDLHDEKGNLYLYSDENDE